MLLNIDNEHLDLKNRPKLFCARNFSFIFCAIFFVKHRRQRDLGAPVRKFKVPSFPKT